MARTIDILKANSIGNHNTWINESNQHINDWPWMKYSYQIAIKVRSRMKEIGLTQTGLAQRIGCSQQYVSLLLKGKENLTLETISKIEAALDSQLITILDYPIEYHEAGRNARYLNETEEIPYGGDPQD